MTEKEVMEKLEYLEQIILFLVEKICPQAVSYEDENESSDLVKKEEETKEVSLGKLNLGEVSIGTLKSYIN